MFTVCELSRLLTIPFFFFSFFLFCYSFLTGFGYWLWNELFTSPTDWRPIYMDSRVCVMWVYKKVCYWKLPTLAERMVPNQYFKKKLQVFECPSPSDKQIYIWSPHRATWYPTITRLPFRGSVVSQQVFRN